MKANRSEGVKLAEDIAGSNGDSQLDRELPGEGDGLGGDFGFDVAESNPSVLVDEGVHDCPPFSGEEGEHDGERVAMGQVRRLVKGKQRLVGFQRVLVVVGVPLQLEEDVVRESVRSVPAVSDGHLLVLPVRQFLPAESVVLDVVDRFQVED